MSRQSPLFVLRRLAAALEQTGANLTIEVAGNIELLRIGANSDRARVIFRTPEALAVLERLDHLAVAEAYLNGGVDIEGDFAEVMKVLNLLDMRQSRIVQLLFWLRFHLPGWRRFHREGIRAHYDRPAEFFLAWLDRWRSYSHGFYRTPDDDLTVAQARKLQYAIEALGLQPNMNVFDMGGGWGSFVEYAGRRGIRVHTITISAEQYRFMSELIRREELPCTVEMIDFLDYRPALRFDGAVFMGTLEHVPRYDRVAAFLSDHLTPEARVYADFCASRSAFMGGAFLRKHIWPGPATYVNVERLVKHLVESGFNIHELHDDTASYACTVRDWAIAIETARGELAARWGEAAVRAFLLLMWGSHWFFTTNRTQAYHLVAGRQPARL